MKSTRMLLASSIAIALASCANQKNDYDTGNPYGTPDGGQAPIASNSPNQPVNPNFITDIIDEMKKVSWPTRSETIRLTSIVIIVSLIIGLYVGIIDVLLAKGLEIITKFR